jgi:N-glycosylase/DNA lyase
MAEGETIKSILAKKAAGVERMRQRQLRVHSRLAEMVEKNPEVISQGLDKVREQLARPLCAARTIYLEWETILTTKSAEYIADLMRDTSDDTEQLRSCAPFTLCV